MPEPSRAVFIAKTDQDGREIPESERTEIEVHFNPETLDITFTNTVQKGNRNLPAQVVNEATAKLNMELVFDTTLDGTDVRIKTNEIARMMDPAQQTPRRRNANAVKVPSIVIFRWGTILFEGYIDTYRERVELFSQEGVPLRAAVTISLSQQQRSFSPAERSGNRLPGQQNLNQALGSNDPIRSLGQNDNLTDIARLAGDSNAGRSLARANGIENLRLPEVNAVVVGSQISGNMASARSSLRANSSGSLGETESRFSNLRTEAGIKANLTSRAKLSLNVGGIQAGFEAGAGMTADVGLNSDIELGIKFEE